VIRKIILEGTDAVGKTSVAQALLAEGITVSDRSRDVISKYMLFSVDMPTRVRIYEEYLKENDVLVIFLVNNDSSEIMRRVYSRERISEFDKLADKYNTLYLDTYREMERASVTCGKLLLADCTGLTLSEQIALVKGLIKEKQG
jgi:hypothetical protein